MGDCITHSDRLYSKIAWAREYPFGTAELTMTPGKAMRWAEWWYAVRAINDWLRVYDSVDLNFDIAVDGGRIVGTGRLAVVYF